MFLWDCISLLDAATIELVQALGGISAIALSHPHFYSSMATWGRTFDCPVLVHEADRSWIVGPDPCIKFWTGEVMEVMSGIALHRLGGHFRQFGAPIWSTVAFFYPATPCWSHGIVGT